MSNSEVKILRDELAKIIADNKKKDSVIEEQARVLDKGKKAIAELIIEIGVVQIFDSKSTKSLKITDLARGLLHGISLQNGIPNTKISSKDRQNWKERLTKNQKTPMKVMINKNNIQNKCL